MKLVFYRAAGILLVIGAILGAVFGIVGLIGLQQNKAEVKAQVVNDAVLVNRALRTTAEGLSVVATALSDARSDLDLIQTSTRNLSAALAETGPTLQTTTDLIGKDLPDVIVNTRRSLSAASNSAKLVDDTLRLIAAIPLIGARYTPDVPLQTSISEVSESLKALPASFQEISKGLQSATGNLQTIQANITELSDEYDRIDASLTEAQKVNTGYQQIVADLLPQTDRIEKRMPVWVDNAYRAATLGMIWLMFTQIALILVGVDWITRRREG